MHTGERPRELRWYHAGPMLFGDLGASRLYVLGLAFAFLGRSSFWYIIAMCGLLVGVGLCYQVICRLFPDGGGVYSSAKQRSQLLAIVGGLLLCADYVVTASLTCLDAYHYLGVHEYHLLGLGLDAALAALTILIIGGLNYFGPVKTGTIAMVIALATIALSLVIALFSLPYLGSARLESPVSHGILGSWVGFTEIVLALSGIEAIANMTGIMVRPVAETARKSIAPVLVEIVVLNIILAAAMSSLSDSILYKTGPGGELIPAHTGDMLKVIAAHYVHPTFAAVSAFVFAALLLSSANTAISDLVSIQFMLSRDRELPRAFSRLNRFGMPRLPLVVATVIPVAVLLLYPQVEKLADLYAIGVVGAIAINLGSTSMNRAQPLKGWERPLMLLMTAILTAIEATIAVAKPHAREFALIVLVVGLASRLATITANQSAPLSRRSRLAYLGFAIVSVTLAFGLALLPGETWLASTLMAALVFGVGFASYRTQHYRSLIAAPQKPGEPKPPPKRLLDGAYKPRERIMVPTTGNPRLVEFALRECKNRRAELMLLFVRMVAITPMGPVEISQLEEDDEALVLCQRVREQAIKMGVPLRFLYGASRDVPDTILDMAATHGADLLLLGTSRRGTLWRAMKGDVIQRVAEHLPERIALLIHA